MPRYFIVAGFDFGTSYSKVVLREDNTQIAVVVRFNGYPEGLLPSLVGYDGFNLLPPSGKNAGYQIPYLKMLAADVTGGIALQNSLVRLPPAVLALASGTGSDLIHELLAFYFAHVIAGVRHFILHESPWKDFGTADDRLLFQMAVPTGLLAIDGRIEKFFREAFVAGYELCERTDPMLTTPMPGAKWSEYVKAVAPLSSAASRERYQWQCLIYPEVAAAVQTILRSPNAQDGLYITMDVGAGTVDINAFRRNSGQHLAAQANNTPYDRRLDYYAASVQPLGVHNLDDPHHAVTRSSPQNLAQQVRQAINLLYLRAKKYQPNHGTPGHRTWDRAILLLFGGGALHWVYPDAFREGLDAVGIANPHITHLSAPDQLACPPNTDFGRFAVAYGMSFPKYNLDKVRLPDELKTFSELYHATPNAPHVPPEPAPGHCRAPEGDGYCGRPVVQGEHYCWDHQ